jgi:hypothetical protein
LIGFLTGTVLLLGAAVAWAAAEMGGLERDGLSPALEWQWRRSSTKARAELRSNALELMVPKPESEQSFAVHYVWGQADGQNENHVEPARVLPAGAHVGTANS